METLATRLGEIARGCDERLDRIELALGHSPSLPAGLAPSTPRLAATHRDPTSAEQPLPSALPPEEGVPPDEDQPTEEPAQAGSATDLERMTLSALRQRAMCLVGTAASGGGSSSAAAMAKVDQALDCDAPRAALIELITSQMVSARRAAQEEPAAPHPPPRHGVCLSALWELEERTRSLRYPLSCCRPTSAPAASPSPSSAEAEAEAELDPADGSRMVAVSTYHELTVQDVLEHVIAPAVRDAGVGSWAELLLLREDQALASSEGGEASGTSQIKAAVAPRAGGRTEARVGPADGYVSYERDCRFGDLVLALEASAGAAAATEAAAHGPWFLWLDVLVCHPASLLGAGRRRHHRPTVGAAWLEALQAVIGAIGHTLLVVGDGGGGDDHRGWRDARSWAELRQAAAAAPAQVQPDSQSWADSGRRAPAPCPAGPLRRCWCCFEVRACAAT
jgi:hypothetical protein